jgi:hypothetical protein
LTPNLTREISVTLHATDQLRLRIVRVRLHLDGKLLTWSFLRDVDILRDNQKPFIQWARLVDFMGIVTKVEILIDEADPSHFDLYVDYRSFLDDFSEVASGVDMEGFAAVDWLGRNRKMGWGLTVLVDWDSSRGCEVGGCSPWGHGSTIRVVTDMLTA